MTIIILRSIIYLTKIKFLFIFIGTPMKELKLQDLKEKSASELIEFAKENDVENASSLRKQELYFAILQNLAEQDIEILGQGVIEVLQDGFGFLRSADANYLPGPDDIYISPSQIRKFSLRTGDTVEGYIRGPKEGERSRPGKAGQTPQGRVHRPPL